MAAALLGTAALAGTRGADWWHERRLSSANDQALAAGRQLAVNFTTIDHRHVQEDVARVKAGATGEFLSSYTRSTDQLTQLIEENKTVSTVEKSEAALVSGDLDSARVIVGIVAPTSNTAVPAGEKKTYRLRLDLAKVGDEWKVSTLEFVA